MKERICPKCKTNKIESSNQGYCNNCRAKDNKKRYKEDKEFRERCIEYSKKNTKKRYKKNKKYKDEYLKNHPCVECRNEDIRVLEFHHRDYDEKEYSVSQMLCMNLEKMIAEINKCDVMCANCHRIFHYEKRKSGSKKYENL